MPKKNRALSTVMLCFTRWNITQKEYRARQGCAYNKCVLGKAHRALLRRASGILLRLLGLVGLFGVLLRLELLEHLTE